ncbi:helix-turn-helix transcriptional regulator [Micromonospora lupini]|nr:helix-turn-helix transcriptional regulator [Micromonospora lupini]
MPDMFSRDPGDPPQFEAANVNEVERVAAKELPRRLRGVFCGCREVMVMAASALLPTFVTAMDGPAAPTGHPPAMRLLTEALPGRAAPQQPAFADLQLPISPESAMRRVQSVPLSLFIADHRLAVVAAPVPDQPGLMIRAPGHVSAMADLFEWIWHRVPEPVADLDALDRRRTAVLAGLAEGLTDAAVANRLRLTERTVRRDVSALMHRAGVASRFQLGAHAQSLGWLGGAPPGGG